MIIADIAPHVFPIFHWNYSIFPNGTLQIPPLKLGPIDLSSSKTFLTTATCIFILIGVGLIALRRSNYGRRLTAMKDSPAAAATLGQNLIKLKLSVFMISAAIAGLGGVLLSSASVSVNADTFIIFISLALVMLTVVGGIGNVAGALMGGILAGTAFQALTTTFGNLSTDAGGGGFWSVMANLSLVAPALIGVSLGRNPSGAVPDIVARYKPLWQAKGVLLLGIMAEVVAYLLVLTKVMGNWWFVLATRPHRHRPAGRGPAGGAGGVPQPGQARPIREKPVPVRGRRRTARGRGGRCPSLRSQRCVWPSAGTRS